MAYPCASARPRRGAACSGQVMLEALLLLPLLLLLLVGIWTQVMQHGLLHWLQYRAARISLARLHREPLPPCRRSLLPSHCCERDWQSRRTSTGVSTRFAGDRYELEVHLQH